MRICDHELIINDTRPIAVDTIHRLSGIKKDIYLEANSAPEKEKLIQKFSRNGVQKEEVEKICEELLAAKIALEIDGRLLALSLRETIPDLPSAVEYPGGVVIHREYSHLVNRVIPWNRNLNFRRSCIILEKTQKVVSILTH
jgi:hypothetical protein